MLQNVGARIKDVGADMVEADSGEKYCESCVRGRNTKFLTREDFEAAQKANAQSLNEFRQSMMCDMRNLWQTAMMPPPPPPTPESPPLRLLFHPHLPRPPMGLQVQPFTLL